MSSSAARENAAAADPAGRLYRMPIRYSFSAACRSPGSSSPGVRSEILEEAGHAPANPGWSCPASHAAVPTAGRHPREAPRLAFSSSGAICRPTTEDDALELALGACGTWSNSATAASTLERTAAMPSSAAAAPYPSTMRAARSRRCASLSRSWHQSKTSASCRKSSPGPSAQATACRPLRLPRDLVVERPREAGSGMGALPANRASNCCQRAEARSRSRLSRRSRAGRRNSRG